MSQFIGRPPPGGGGKTIAVLIVCQVLATLYDHWLKSEDRKEASSRRERAREREKSALRAKIAALREMCSMQVDIEEARSRSFIAAMEAAAATEDPAVARQILEVARETLLKPQVVQSPQEGHSS